VISAGTGIGGGAFYLVAYILIIGLDPHVAIPLSKATILGLAIGGYIINIRLRHPKANRPLIDYDLALLIEPMVLLGTLIGVLLNIVFPSIYILISLVLLLTLIIYLTVKKGLETYRKEKAEIEAKNKPNMKEALINKEEEAIHPELQKIFDQEERLVHWEKIPVFILFWCIFIFVVLLAGGDGNSLMGVDCGTDIYWGLIALAVPIMFSLSSIAAIQLYNLTKKKQLLNYPFQDGDIIWTPWTLIRTSILCISGGIASGFLGVGGGMLLGPIFLSMGMVPIVATITASFMILFTATSTTTQFIVFGKIQWDYALWYGTTGFISAIIGQLLIQKMLKKWGRQSYVAFILAAVIALSLIFFVVLSIRGLIEEPQQMFHGVCG